MNKKSFVALLTSFVVAVSCQMREKEPFKSSVEDWLQSAVIYEVNIRQYTPEGTFNAFAEHLPRLRELGVDVLWLMPVNPISEEGRKGSLGSYYAVADYKGVNPQFGTEEDLRLLISKAHELGMKVVLDWVANHTGCDNAWTKQHPDWYVRNEDGEFCSPYDWTDTYELNYDNKEMRQGMIDAMKYWIVNYDVDGFRCDVAYEVPYDFWKEARPALDSVKPMFMLAESEKPEYQQNGTFDMCYNWPLKNVMFDIVNGRANAMSVDSLFSIQQTLFPEGNIMMNHLTNHDLNSWDGSEIERFGDATRAFAVLSYTLPGMPLMYTGQEVGMDKRLQFFEKDSVGSWDSNEWTSFYTRLNKVKHDNIALCANGKWSEVEKYDVGSCDVLAFCRSSGDNSVLTVVNMSASSVELSWPDSLNVDGFVDVFDGSKVELPTQMGAWEYELFLK